MTSYASSLMTTQRPWQQMVIPDAVGKVRSMLSDEEKRYLIWLTSGKVEGWGAIVELGVWLGSSSAALAEGLRGRGSDAKIRSYDLFVWENYMRDAAKTDLAPGDDFLPLYWTEVGEYAPWIEAQKVDLMNCSWDRGPIEILFIDSAKTWELTNAVLRTFGPHLVPGKSRVVLQDFRYGYAHCLPLIFDSRPDVWKQVEDVETGATVTFVLLKDLFGPSGISADYAEESFPLPSADHLLRTRIDKEEPHNKSQLLQGLYRKYLIDGPLEEALVLKQQVLDLGIAESDLDTLENVDVVVQPRGWAACSAGDYVRAKDCALRCLTVQRNKSIYALTLLAFSSLHLGDRDDAEKAIADVRRINPDFVAGWLFRVEAAIKDGSYADAASDALKILKDETTGESDSEWSLNLLSRAWDMEGTGEPHLDLLMELPDRVRETAAFRRIAETQMKTASLPSAQPTDTSA